jgi:carbamoylphosphate synthase small subunit
VIELTFLSLSACTNTHTCKTFYNLTLYLPFYADDVDTRAITRRLREDGSLIGVLSTDESRTDAELLEMTKKWKIVGTQIFRKLYLVLHICNQKKSLSTVGYISFMC